MILVQKYRRNKSFAYFAMYSLTCVFFGCAIVGLGPAIPFMAKQANIQQTQYSFLFMSRAVGFVIMTLLIKVIQKYFNMHTLMIVGSIVFSVCYIGFAFTMNLFLQGAFLCIGSAAISLMMIVNSQAMLVSHTGSDQQFWLQLNHGTFGIGGLIGPLIIRFLQLKGFLLIALLQIAVCPLYFIYQSPQINNNSKDNKGNSDQANENLIKVPQTALKYFYLTSIIIIGVEVSFPGWSPSYAVLQGVQTQTGATKFSSFFWISMTVSRFIFAFFDATVVEKLIFSVKCSVAFSVFCSFCCLIRIQELALYVSAFSLGLFFAPYFPLTLGLAGQLKHKLSDNQVTNLFVFASIGEGLVSYIYGIFMQHVSLDMFFYLTTLICLVLYLSLTNTISILKNSLAQTQQRLMKQASITQNML